MKCPLCNDHLLSGGPALYRVWMEMESNEEIIVGVHLSCLWDAARDKLYAKEENGATPEYTWIGWEPMTPLGESKS